MKLLILGATGPTGRHVLDVALGNGDQVTVLARRPEVLREEFGDRITLVAGDATSKVDVAAAAVGQDVIVSALGRAKSFRARSLFTQAATAVVGAAEQSNVDRLVWLSSFGVGDTYASASLVQKVMYSTFLRDLYADKAASEVTIRTSGLDWTLVYPTTLTNKPAKGAYRTSERLAMKGAPTISRADVGEFLHRVAHDPRWAAKDAVITD